MYHGLLSQVFAKRDQPSVDPTPSMFRQQVKNPSETFSLLLIIGGEVVQKAIAQGAGLRINLVCFSFGWVAYAFSAMLSAFGDGRMMPDPDYPAMIINPKSYMRKSNYSWVISRLIRDLEIDVESKHKPFVDDDRRIIMEDGNPVKATTSGLLITIYEACDSPAPGVPARDLRWFLYFPFTVLQLGVASIPAGLYWNWSILLITGVGVMLSLLSGSMSEWRREKFECRRGSKDDYLITRGNGHRHVFLIRGIQNDHGLGLNLEDLAAARGGADIWTRAKTVVYAVTWLLFLLAAGGLKQDTWYLVFVGAAGMAQNIFVAGARRSSASHGIPLNPARAADDSILTYGLRSKGSDRPRVMNVLREVEQGIPGVGLALLYEFFPDHTLRDAEKRDWETLKASVKQRRKEKSRYEKPRYGLLDMPGPLFA